MVAGPMAVGADPIVVSKLLGFAASAALVFFLWRDLSRTLARGTAFAAGLLLVADPAYCLWTTAGLETPLFLLFAYLAARELQSEGGGITIRTGLWCGLAALTRPEGYLLAAILFGVALARRQAGPLFRSVLLFAALTLPHLAFRLVYYGSLLPNTFYAKAAVGTALGRGAGYLAEWLFHYGAWPMAALAALSALRPAAAPGGPSARRAVWVILVAAFAAYVVAVGGDGLTMYRFALFVALPLVPLAAAGAARLAERLEGRARALAPAILLAAAALVMTRNSFAGEAYRFARDDRDRVNLHWINIGKWLARHMDDGESVSVGVAGAIPYYGRVRAIDMLGITDAHIARSPRREAGGISGHEKHDMDYVLSQKPTFLIHYPFLLKSPSEPWSVNEFKTEWNPGLASLLENKEFDRAYRGELAEVRVDSTRVFYLHFFRRRYGIDPPGDRKAGR